MMPRSDWAVPRFGASPRRVRSSAASTTDRSASIIGTAAAPGGRGRVDRISSTRLAGGGFLHEPQPILDLLLFLVHVQKPQVLLDGRAHPLLEGVALGAQILNHPLDLARLARGLVEQLPALDLGLLDHQLGLLARLLLDVLG